MKLSLIIALIIISFQSLATGGGPEAGRAHEKSKQMKSRSVIIGTGTGTDSDTHGTRIRKDHQKRNSK